MPLEPTKHVNDGGRKPAEVVPLKKQLPQSYAEISADRLGILRVHFSIDRISSGSVASLPQPALSLQTARAGAHSRVRPPSQGETAERSGSCMTADRSCNGSHVATRSVDDPKGSAPRTSAAFLLLFNGDF
jgi:hypothetical protein